MSDWKGKRVIVSVTSYDSEKLFSGLTIYMDGPIYLDTDTMSDIFEKYDPSEHFIKIEPYEGDDE